MGARFVYSFRSNLLEPICFFAACASCSGIRFRFTALRRLVEATMSARERVVAVCDELAAKFRGAAPNVVARPAAPE